MTVAERPLDPESTRTPIPELLVPGSLVFRKHAGPGQPRRLPQLVGVPPGRVLEAARRPGHDARRPRPPPGRPRRLRGRRGLRRLGRQGAADRGRVGVRRARRPRRRRVRLGRRARPGGKDDGEHLAGRVPVAEPEGRRLRGHLTGRKLPAQRLRPVRHGGQRLGVDVRLVRPASPRRGASTVLRPDEPAGDLAGREL